MSVYIMPGFADYQDLLSLIGVLKSAVKQPWNHSPITCRLFSVSIRYIGPDEGPGYAETFHDTEVELVRLMPGVIRTWDYNDDV